MSQSNSSSSNHAKITTDFQPPISLAQLVSSTPAPRPWPLAGLLPAGLCLLAAKPHAGSSMLALQLALSIACDKPALGHFTPQSGRVLYLGYHDYPSTILPPAQNLLDGVTPPATLEWTNSWQPWDQDGLSTLTDWLQDHPDTRLIVIDSLTNLFPPDNPTSLARKCALLAQLSKLAHTHHLTILLLHHLARSSGSDPFDAIACSPLMLDTVDTLAVLEHNRGGIQATLHLTGSQVETHSLALERNERGWSLDPSLTRISLTPERIAVLQILEQAGHSLAPIDIAKALGKESSTVRRLLFTMVRAGLISPVGDNRYIPVLPMLNGQPQDPDTPPITLADLVAISRTAASNGTAVTPGASNHPTGQSNGHYETGNANGNA